MFKSERAYPAHNKTNMSVGFHAGARELAQTGAGPSVEDMIKGIRTADELQAAYDNVDFSQYKGLPTAIAVLEATGEITTKIEDVEKTAITALIDEVDAFKDRDCCEPTDYLRLTRTAMNAAAHLSADYVDGRLRANLGCLVGMLRIAESTTRMSGADMNTHTAQKIVAAALFSGPTDAFSASHFFKEMVQGLQEIARDRRLMPERDATAVVREEKKMVQYG